MLEIRANFHSQTRKIHTLKTFNFSVEVLKAHQIHVRNHYGVQNSIQYSNTNQELISRYLKAIVEFKNVNLSTCSLSHLTLKKNVFPSEVSFQLPAKFCFIFFFRKQTHVNSDGVDPVDMLHRCSPRYESVELVEVLVPGHGIQFVSLQLEVADKVDRLTSLWVLGNRHSHHPQHGDI